MQLTSKKLVAVIVMACGSAFSQTGGIKVPLYTQNIAPINQATVRVIGNSGSGSYFYWVVSQFTFGPSQPIGPFFVLNGPTTLSSANYNLIAPGWTQGQGIISADILRTSSPIAPAEIGRAHV